MKSLHVLDPCFTHIPIDQNIKPDGVGFDKSAIVRPVVHLVVFGKPGKTSK